MYKSVQRIADREYADDVAVFAYCYDEMQMMPNNVDNCTKNQDVNKTKVFSSYLREVGHIFLSVLSRLRKRHTLNISNSSNPKRLSETRNCNPDNGS